jgi:hypothetical protein
MLPAIVIILFCNGAMTAVNAIMQSKDEQQRVVVGIFALCLGILPAWQTAEVWHSATRSPFTTSSVSRIKYLPNVPRSEVGERNSRLP